MKKVIAILISGLFASAAFAVTPAVEKEPVAPAKAEKAAPAEKAPVNAEKMSPAAPAPDKAASADKTPVKK